MSVAEQPLLDQPDDAEIVPASSSDIAARSPLQLFARRLRRDKLALFALVVIFLIVLVGVFPGVIRSIFGLPDPNVPNADLTNLFGGPLAPNAPSPEDPDVTAGVLGTDNLGRDILTRVIYGAQVSLIVAFASTAITVVVGVTLGMLAAYYRGWVDTLLARLMDLTLAFPIYVLAIGLGVACADGCEIGPASVEPGLPVVIFVISVSTWPYMARIVRGQVLSLREREFVEASRSLGAPDRRIIFREILPNLVAPIVVYATILIPQNILFEASLSFLGVGVDPSRPSWGAMLATAGNPDYLANAWWFMAFPGVALLITVLAFNLLGDGLQDALNPRTAK